uniref:Disks large-associated protein 5 n=1 Tax=Lygus hesperus TaxID=30085 RepID=A0A0A9W8F1_LYGHE
MEGRLLNRRNDAKERRKTLRHSVLEEKRKTALSSSDTTPETEDRPGPSLRNRAANRAVKGRPEAAGQLQERKARQARTAKEVLKVRPPFNNYIRVKHTGLSPFRSYQDASKRSKVAPWRAPPPKVLLPSSSGCQAEATGRQKKANAAPSQPDPTGRGKPAPGTSQLPIPRSNMAAGVVLFGTGAHNTAKEVKPPPKRVSRRPVEASSRVLRSSQVPGQDDKENLPSDNRSIVVAKKSQRERSLNLAGSSGNAVPVTAPPAEERTKGLEERSAQLAKETDRLRNLADEWSSLKSTLSLPTSIADEIDSITGQTMLLISKKFIQYKNLIEGAYTEMRTTLEDLDGFWEMVYIQVRQLDDRYKGLNDMKEKNWRAYQIFQDLKNVTSRKTTEPTFLKFLAEKLKINENLQDVPPNNQ